MWNGINTGVTAGQKGVAGTELTGKYMTKAESSCDTMVCLRLKPPTRSAVKLLCLAVPLFSYWKSRAIQLGTALPLVWHTTQDFCSKFKLFQC